MTTRPPQMKPVQTRPRRVHVVMRDGTTVDGGVYLTDGHALAPYLGSRKSGWVNIVNALWPAEGDVHNHAVLQAEHILMVSALDGDVAVHFPPPGAIPRPVDIRLEDGSRIQGSLQLADRQRMSDYLAGCGAFMPVVGARRVPGNEELGDIALNAGCVRAVRDAKVFSAPAPGAADAGDAAAGRASVPDAIAAPVNRDVVRRLNGAFDVITPGRVPDRRAGQQRPAAPAPADDATPRRTVDPIPSFAESARAARVSRHWLVLLAVGARLLPPEARALSDPLKIDEIWRAIAARNEMAAAELAVHVASAFGLEVANLDEATAGAVQLVPEKLARRLGVLPVKVDSETLTIAVSDPDSLEIEQHLGFVTKLKLRLVIATPDDIRGAIDWHYHPGRSA